MVAAGLLLQQLLIGPVSIWSDDQEPLCAVAHTLGRYTLELPRCEVCREMRVLGDAADGSAPVTNFVILLIVHVKVSCSKYTYNDEGVVVYMIRRRYRKVSSMTV